MLLVRENVKEVRDIFPAMTWWIRSLELVVPGHSFSVWKTTFKQTNELTNKITSSLASGRFNAFECVLWCHYRIEWLAAVNRSTWCSSVAKNPRNNGTFHTTFQPIFINSAWFNIQIAVQVVWILSYHFINFIFCNHFIIPIYFPLRSIYHFN